MRKAGFYQAMQGEMRMTAYMEDARTAAYPTMALIQKNYSNMSKGQQRIADYVLHDPNDVVKSSISEFAQKTGNKSESAIVRFYRSLGFKAYKEFKLKVTQEIAGRTFYHSYEDISMEDSPEEIKRKIFNGAMLTLDANASLDNSDEYKRAVDLLLRMRRIVLLGQAVSAAICYYAHFRFLELGLNCHFSPDAHINAAILANPAPDDLFFCVSMSGETRDIVEPLANARAHGSSILSVTGAPDSTLARLSDVVITVTTDETTMITDAMNARISQMCTIDALFSMASIACGEGAFNRLLMTRKTFRTLKNKSSGVARRRDGL